MKLFRGYPVLLAVALAVSACGRSATIHRSPIQVKVWSMWSGGNEEAGFESVLAYYNRTHPGVVLENLGGVDDAKTVRAIVAGAPPDVVTISDPTYLGTLAANGALEDLDSRFRASGLSETAYTPGALGQCRYRGRLYAMPYLIDCIGLLYNKDVFASAGLDPNKPPRTFAELQADCRRITKRDSSGRLLRIGLSPQDISPTMLFSMFGGRLIDDRTGRISADDPRNIEAVNRYIGLMSTQGGYEELAAFASGFGANMGGSNPFYIGDVGMIVSGEWNPYWIYHYSPTTHYGVAPLPYPADRPDLKGEVWLGVNPFCIPQGSHHAKEAWDFLVWTQTPKAQQMLALSLHNVPNILAELSDPVLRTGEPWRPYFGLFMDLAKSPNALYFPAMPVAPLYQNQLSTAIDDVGYHHASPATVLRRVRERVQLEMDKYGQ